MPVERQLALEIRSWKFGYAVLEGENLLDWGVRWFPPGESKIAIRRLTVLLKVHTPSVVVTRSTRRVNHGSSESAAHVLRTIRDELKRRSIRFVALARRDARTFFAQRGCRNKHEVALAVANRFGQLKPRVPKLRKAWDPESAIAAVFDAIATTMAFAALRQPAIDA